MPSSDYNSIPKVLQVVEHLGPLSILDVGVGNGRYGFLFREVLDWNHGRIAPEDWAVQIDGVEVEQDYLQSHHKDIYNRIMLGDWLTDISLSDVYSLIFMGDVLEHFKEGDWQQALVKARAFSDVTLVVCPNHVASLAQGAWHGHEHERHHVLLTPDKLGGRLLYGNSKIFMVGFDNRGVGCLDSKDACL